MSAEITISIMSTETEMNTSPNCYKPKPKPTKQNIEDIDSIDTLFFCTERFTADIIEKNLRQAINLASSKADACRRIMALETCGYIVLSNVSDERKAELINPFAAPKYIFTQDDFKNARRYARSNTK